MAIGNVIQTSPGSALFPITLIREIKVHYLIPENDKKAFEIKPQENGDWLDLRCAKNIALTAGQVVSIPLGVAMELPQNYEAYVSPRSSLLERHGLIGVFSIIDNSYCGDDDEWHLQVYATRDTSLEFGERIAQFRITEKMPPVVLHVVDSLGNPNRGGLGTSGHK